jgi:signal transduction histidine kinase
MSHDLLDTLAALGQVGGWLDAALRETGEAAGRSLLLARLLQQVWPAAPLAACLLTGPGGPALTALDGSGRARPDWVGPLRADLLQVAEAEPSPTAPQADPPRALGLAGHPLVVARAVAGGRCRAVLAVAMPAGAPAEFGPRVALLGAVANQLAPRLQVEEQQAELAVEARTAVLGELARPVTHEFNNFLNVLLLQVTVLEMELPEHLQADLKEIRRHGTVVASLIRQLQRYRQPPAGPASADLNEVIAQAAEDVRRGAAGVAVELDLAPALPRVPAAVPELRRLCFFLLKNAAAVADPQAGAVAVRTEASGGRAVARFEDNGPAIPEEHLPQPFDPNVPAREGTNALEMAACRGMARRLEGGLAAENRPGGGVAFVLDLPAS